MENIAIDAHACCPKKKTILSSGIKMRELELYSGILGVCLLIATVILYLKHEKKDRQKQKEFEKYFSPWSDM